MSRRKRKCSTRFSLFSFQDIITCLMGIMLLLTLMICLQVTDKPTRSSEEVQKRSTEMQADVLSLQAEMSDLERQVSENTAVLESGALSNQTLLREKQQAISAAQAAAERELLVMLQQSMNSAETLNSTKSAAETKRQSSEASIAQLIQEASRQEKSIQQMLEGRRVVYNRYVGSASACWIIEVTSDTNIKAAQIGRKQVPLTFSSVNEVLQWTRERHREGSEFLLLLKPGASLAIDRLPGTLREEGIAHGYDLLGQDQTALDPVTGADVL